MLAALLLLGVLPLAIMPIAETDDDDDDVGVNPNTATAPSTPIPEEEEGEEVGESETDSGSDDDLADGTVYTVGTGLSETVIAEFVPGEDILEVDLTGVSDEIVFDMATSASSSWVSFGISPEATTTIEFSNLTEIPFGDIILKMTDEDTGDAFEQSLNDVFAIAPEIAADPTESVTTGVLDPSDPEAVTVDPVDSELPVDPLTPIDPMVPVDPLAPADPSTPVVTLDPVIDPLDPDPTDGTVIGPVDPEVPGDPGPPIIGPVTDPIDPNLPEVTPTLPIVGPVIDPTDPTELLGGLDLSDLISRDGLWGAGTVLTGLTNATGGFNDISLGETDDTLSLVDDGVAGTGAGALELVETMPTITTSGMLDIVDGGAGDDTITAGDAAAYVFGGEGDDSLVAGDGAAAIFGGAGDDVLGATTTAAFLDGGVGDDLVSGGAGDDTLEGGEHGAFGIGGADTIDGGAGNDLIRGGLGADLLSGGNGDDVIDHHGRSEQREIIEHHEFAWHIDGAADSLEGGEGDDTLIFDQMDVATGGAGNDVFWLYNDGSDGADIAEITDFEVGADFLRVSLNPQIGENDEPFVSVEPSLDGADGMVTVNGDLIAILRGAPTATPADIYAEVQADVFP